jgi:hypothetical protein
MFRFSFTLVVSAQLDKRAEKTAMSIDLCVRTSRVRRPTGGKAGRPMRIGWLMSRDYRDPVPVTSRIAQDIVVGWSLLPAALDALFELTGPLRHRQ